MKSYFFWIFCAMFMFFTLRFILPHYKMKHIILFIVLFNFFNVYAQEQEIVLVGTMHVVPKIVKNSYRPLFKEAYHYGPEAIFVETVMPNDSLSWAYLQKGYSKNHQKFFSASRKLRETFNYDKDSLNFLISKDFGELSDMDFRKIKQYFLYNLDSPNYYYYDYLEKYYPNGHKKSMRHENTELTRKLALKLNHKKVYAADDQQTNGEFHKYWKKCEEEIMGTRFEKRGKRIGVKLVSREIFPSIVGRYGRVNNKWKHLQLLDSLSGLKYADQQNCNCKKAIDYFNQRNKRFANNLGSQIKEHNFRKSILFVGAAHIVGLKKELNEQFPDIKVILFDEL